MFHRAVQTVQKFFVALAATLTGLGVVCMAVGFLAERAHWSMLGLPLPAVDLNEYLFTGARFLAFLPGVFLTTTLTAITWSLSVFGLVIVAVVLLVVAHRWRGRQWLRRIVTTLSKRSHFRGRVLRLVGLIALALLQFSSTYVLFRAARIRNVLFLAPTRSDGAECGQAGLDLEVQIVEGCQVSLDAHLGTVFLIVLVNGTLLWLFLRAMETGGGKAAERGTPTGSSGEAGAGPRVQPRPWGEALTVALNAALLGIQLILLPINYGALFLRSEFPVVDVVLTDPESREGAWPEDGRLLLLHRWEDEFYLYGGAAGRVWLVPRSDVESLVFLGICRIFEEPGQCLGEEA